MNLSNLNSFLHLGYFLDYKNPDINFDLSNLELYKRELTGLSNDELFQKASSVWYKTFEDLFSEGKQVVPISGGIDSRAILATLLKFTDVSNIETYTFGTPGTYDYDIGNFIAKKIGTKHNSFSFENYKFTNSKEISVSKRIGHQTFLYHHPPLEKLDLFYRESNIWSGYILDWLAGSYLPVNSEYDLTRAKRNVLSSGEFVKSIKLCNSSLDEIEELMSIENLIDPTLLSYEEQLQIQNHLVKYTGPHILYNNFKYKIPALDQNFYLFYLALDNDKRRNQSFYKYFLQKEFPEFFKMPIKALNGLPLIHNKFIYNCRRVRNKAISKINNIHPTFLNPHLNYMDFNEGIRKREDLNQVVYNNIKDLIDRKILEELEIERIYQSHMKRKRNHADALMILSSLEIHLKAGKKI